MALSNLEEVTGTLRQLHDHLAPTALRGYRSLPPPVEDAVLMHLTMGIEATRRALHAADGPLYRYYLAHAREELAAARALL